MEEERVNEAAGANSAAGSFGLSFGLAMAGGIMRAVLSFSFTHMTDNGAVIASAQQEQIATTLEDNAEVMSNAQLAALLADEPKDAGDEILRIYSESRDRSLRVALLVQLLASLVGLMNGFRMRRLPDIEPVANREGLDFLLIGVKN